MQNLDKDICPCNVTNKMAGITVDQLLQLAPVAQPAINWLNVSESDKSWTGGVIDVDCQVRVSVSTNLQVSIRKCIQKIGTLEKLQNLFGGSLSSSGSQKVWTLTNSHASEFCNELQQYCHARKMVLAAASKYCTEVLKASKWVPVEATHVDTGDVLRFDSVKSAAHHFGQISAYQLSTRLTGGQDQVMNHIWRKLQNPLTREIAIGIIDTFAEDVKVLQANIKNIAPTVETLDAAYTAGLFEGAGCIQADPMGNQLWIKISNAALCHAMSRQFHGNVSEVQVTKTFWSLQGNTDAFVSSIMPFVSDGLRIELQATIGRQAAPAILVTHEMLRTGVKQVLNIKWDTISEDQCWWTGGQIDGDGCCRICPVNGLTVRVGKAESGWACLVYLKQVYGGSIFDGHVEKDNKQAFKEWCVKGADAWDFCMTIKNFCHLKTNQLSKACEFCFGEPWMARMRPLIGINKLTGETKVYPSCTKAAEATGTTTGSISKCINPNNALKSTGGCTWQYLENTLDLDQVREKRVELVNAVQDMKKVEHCEINVPLKPAYMAGFVDADGHLRIVNKGTHQHSVTQKYRAICDAFRKQYGGCIVESCRTDKTDFTWSTHKHNGKKFLEDIAPYLVEKRVQADLILAMKPGEGPQIAAALSKINGSRLKAAIAAAASQTEIDELSCTCKLNMQPESPTY